MRGMLRRGADGLVWLARGALGMKRERYDRSLYDVLAGMREWSASDVVFDVGANDGRTALRLMRHLGVAPRLYCFEPVGSTFRALEARTSRHANVRRFQLAMGSQAGPRTIYVGDLSVMSSFDPEWPGEGRGETVEVTTLDAFAQEHDVPRIHLLKVDAEGHDLEVLRGARRTLEAGRVDVVQVECGIAPGRTPTLEEVRSHMFDRDYHLYGINTQARGHPPMPDGERARPRIMTYCDALFVCGRLPMG